MLSPGGATKVYSTTVHYVNESLKIVQLFKDSSFS
jgi:hypothetical protein